ncbi:uncharacterized protein LOC119562250 isoform X3 [Drosophila subpulchrella]|uniref:uncharacterized protein LOC119557666 isoform X3 n=1 Tax=Drosophila subpulchrella TaxID=1486046 RepID=UPI0018A16E20|nr:uncharacterized protein LOC119557666 isoform X3 [Drosophila subpulchrella]XP_037731353.1 uncharacterized protein LOC119562250 isoform X3 [Drosophila subpulchrella]
MEDLQSDIRPGSSPEQSAFTDYIREAVVEHPAARRRTRACFWELCFVHESVPTALVPSLTACLANSPGRSRRTAVWISRLVMVERLL